MAVMFQIIVVGVKQMVDMGHFFSSTGSRSASGMPDLVWDLLRRRASVQAPVFRIEDFQ